MQNHIEEKNTLGMTDEEDVPIDGKDIEGEEMIKSVRNDKLENPPPLQE